MAITATHTQSAAKSGSAYAIYVLILLLLTGTLSNADRHVFSVLLPSIKEEFNLSNSMLGLLAGPGFVIPFVLLTMPLARLADRWSRRSVLAGALAFWSIASGLCGVVTNAMQLTIARVCVGMGEAGGGPPAQSMVTTLFSKRRSAAMGVLASGTYFGILVGLAGGAALAAAFGWRGAFIILAIPGVPLALLIWLTGPRRKAPLGAKGPAQETLWQVLQRCLRIRSLVLLAVGMGAFNIYGYGAAIWLPSYFTASHGMSMVQAGIWLGAGVAIGGILGSFASGAIVDALAPRDQRWQLRVPAMGFLLSFPLTIVMFLMPGALAVNIAGQAVPAVALLSIATAFLTSLWMGPTYAALARLVPADIRGQAIGLLSVVINIMGSVLGPPIAGGVSDLLTAQFGAEALRYSLLTMSSLIIVGGLVFWRASAHYRREIIEE